MATRPPPAVAGARVPRPEDPGLSTEAGQVHRRGRRIGDAGRARR